MTTKNSNELPGYRRLFKFPGIGLIVKVFKHEKEIRKQVLEYRYDTPKSKVAIPGHAFISNPTEQQALKNITPIRQIQCDDGFWLKNPEKWLEVVDEAYKFCPNSESVRAIRMWTEGYHAYRICAEVGMTTTTYYNLRQRVQDYAAAVAAQFGLINIIKRKDDEDASEKEDC